MLTIKWGKEEKKDGMLEKYEKYIKFLPLFLWVWVVWQILVLIQYDALPIFSWTQVVNDTVILLVPFSMIFLGFYAAKNDKHMGNYWLFLTIIRLIATCVIWVIGFSLFWWLMKFVTMSSWRDINYKIYALLIVFYCVGLFVWYILEPGGKNSWPIKNHAIRNFFRPSAFLVCILITILASALWSLFSYTICYDWVKVSLHWEKETQVIQYMNDKYIIYWSGQFVPNDPEYAILVKSQNAWTWVNIK